MHEVRINRNASYAPQTPPRRPDLVLRYFCISLKVVVEELSIKIWRRGSFLGLADLFSTYCPSTTVHKASPFQDDVKSDK